MSTIPSARIRTARPSALATLIAPPADQPARRRRRGRSYDNDLGFVNPFYVDKSIYRAETDPDPTTGEGLEWAAESPLDVGWQRWWPLRRWRHARARGRTPRAARRRRPPR